MPDWFEHPCLAVALLFVAVGFWLLGKGADALVAGAVALGRRLRLSPAVIGATVVAFGTSLPEVVVSLAASIQALGHPEQAAGLSALAIGNVTGSNIFNTGGILGLALLLRPAVTPAGVARHDYPWMLAALVAFILVSLPLGGPPVIARWEGVLLLTALAVFTVQAARRGRADHDETAPLEELPPHLGRSLGLVALGVLLLVMAGKICLNGAVAIAQTLGLSERVIGVTVLAAGTSLPELATSIQAARRGHHDIAIANVIGSNIFNVFCIIGLCATVGPLAVNHGSLAWDYWWMLGINLLLLPFLLWRGGRLGRGAGLLMLGGQVAYTVSLLFMSGN